MTTNRIVFIDSRVADSSVLLQGLPVGTETHFIRSGEDGLVQIATLLAGLSGIDTIDIISHGAEGTLYLGDTVLDGDKLNRHASALAAIGQALTMDGDILLYGCDVAAGASGVQFINQFAALTNADVAASNDITGSAMLGGDWLLESTVGRVDSSPVLNTEHLDTYHNNLFLPVLVGSYDTPGTAVDVAVSGNKAYVADYEGGLQILDIGNPANPTLIGNYATSANSVALSGNSAYITQVYSGMAIINVSNPSSPTLRGGYNSDWTQMMDMVVSGYTAYVANYYSGGLRIIDISNPATPTLLGSYDTAGDAYGVKVVGGTAYIADGGTGLTILDVSNSAAPALLGTVDTPGFAYNVAINGNTAYVADSDFGIGVIDISNPANPIFLSSFGIGGYANNITVSGKIAYVANNNGVVAIDVSNPIAPVLINSYLTTGAANGVAVNGHYAYVADGATGGLQIVQMSLNSTPIGNVVISGNAVQGQILTASNSLSDADGLGLITYQWKADNVSIGTGNIYQLTAADVGKTITVTASYTDLQNTAENVVSSETDVVLAKAETAPSFAVGDGILTTDFGAGNDQGHSVTVQTDSKILVAGSSYDGNYVLSPYTGYALVLARYNVDGSLDNNFDTDGRIATGDDAGNGIVLQPDGKIVVAGATWGSSPRLTRYNADGSLDIEFGTEGSIELYIDGQKWNWSPSVTLQTDGKILVAGTDNASHAVLARFNANGTLDTGFDTDGQVVTGFGGTEAFGSSVALQTDGKILVAGYCNVGGSNVFALARYNTDGSLDLSFDTDGLITTDFSSTDDQSRFVTVQPDSKILVAGYAYVGNNNDFAMVRYNSDGSLDTSFDTDGKLTIAFPGSSDDGANSIVLQPNGKILVVGTTGYAAESNIALVRLNADGSRDLSFDTDGRVITDIDADADSGQSITLQADGKILAAGHSYNGIDDDFVLARYNTDGSLDPSFDPINTLDGTPHFTEGGAAVVLDDNVQIYDAESVAVGNYNNTALYLECNGGANSQDIFIAKAGGTLGALIPDSNLVVNGITIGTVHANSGGSLALYFGDNATQTQVNTVMRQIAYRNDSDAPPTSVQIYWNFSDGNGGPGANGSTTVAITGVNDSPTGKVSISGTPIQGQILIATNTLADADGLGLISYQWKANNVNIGTGGNTYQLTAADVGKTITVTASYTDLQNTAESAVSSETSTVLVNANTAPSFAVGDGKLTTNFRGDNEFPGYLDEAKTVIALPDGKILAVGTTRWNGLALVRYNADGSVDSSFGTDGQTLSDVSGAAANSTVLQPDGKIVVMTGTNDRTFTVQRFLDNGTLDVNFATDGKLTGNLGIKGESVTLQTDGKILVAGYNITTVASGNFAMARYTADGYLDTSFGTGGTLYTDYTDRSELGSSVTLQSDGKILVVGFVYHNSPFYVDFALARYNTDGSLDVSFATDGEVTTGFGWRDDYPHSVVVQPDGKILVGGSADNGHDTDFALVRYNTDGSLDTDFHFTGLVTMNFANTYDTIYGITLQPDGKILVAGDNSSDFALARFNQDGSRDTSFDTDARLTTDFGTNSDTAKSVTLQSDGKILVVGRSGDNADSNFALARYNPNGSLDSSFDPVNTLNGAPLFTKGGLPVVLDTDVQIYDAQLASAGNYAGASLTLTRDGGAKAQDVFSAKQGGTLAALNQGGNLTVNSVTIGSVISNSNGNLVLKFNSSANQKLLNAAIQQIAYSNTSVSPPASAQINWTFNDGNSGTQGSGGALTTTGSTTVTITSGNNAPSGTDSSVTTLEDTAFVFNTTHFGFSDINDNPANSLANVLITNLPTAGSLQLNGIAVAANQVISVANINSKLLKFIPAANANGNNYASFNFKVQDNGGTVNNGIDSSATTNTVTINVTAVNDLPTGNVTLTGTPTQGQTLTASDNLADVDGLGPMSYTWKTGATVLGIGKTYTLAATDVGKTITAMASYTDSQGTLESKSSLATPAVSPLSTPAFIITKNDLLTGEDGDTAIIGVKLATAPTQNVSVTFTGSDLTEGTITNSTLIFTPSNWQTAQNFTVIGQNDFIDDGNQPYFINATISSDDVNYRQLRIDPIVLTNLEDVTMSADSRIPIGTPRDIPIKLYGDIQVDSTVIVDGFFKQISSFPANDILHGLDGNDILYGKDLQDELSGGIGNDVLYGGNDQDFLYGQDGNDYLWGEQDADKLDGGAGNDTLDGGSGLDTMIGGAGNDTYYLGYDAVDTIDDQGLATDVDTIIMPYLLTSYTLPSSIENGTIAAGTATSSLTGNSSNNTLTGNDGKNSLDGAVGRDSLYGGAGNDALLGGDDNDALSGGTGADHLEGGSGNDSVDGGAGNDEIVGGSGAGDDIYIGGLGIDTLKYTSAITGITVDLASGTASGTEISADSLSGIENIIGGQAGDLLNGSVGKNTLNGYTGNDTITGGAGKDILTGGLGADRFKFNSETETGITVAARDVISDFKHTQGDKINLSGIDANKATADNDGFSIFTAAGTFSGSFTSPGRLYFNQTAHILYGNNDADSAADFSIQLTGVNILVVADLVL